MVVGLHFCFVTAVIDELDMITCVPEVEAARDVSADIFCCCDGMGVAQDDSGKDEWLFRVPSAFLNSSEFLRKAGVKAFADGSLQNFVFRVVVGYHQVIHKLPFLILLDSGMQVCAKNAVDCIAIDGDELFVGKCLLHPIPLNFSVGVVIWCCCHST